MGLKAQYNPNPSDAWVKNALAEPMAEDMRAAGLVPDGNAIEAEVRRMLSDYDARERAGDLTPRTRVPDADRARREDPAADAAQETGWRFGRNDPAIVHRHQQAQRMTPWVLALKRRIHQIIAVMPGTRWRDQQFRYPALARAFVQEFVARTGRSGDYANLTEREVHLKFSRFCEDLADRSTGILGAWRKRGV